MITNADFLKIIEATKKLNELVAKYNGENDVAIKCVSAFGTAGSVTLENGVPEGHDVMVDGIAIQTIGELLERGNK